MSAETEHSTTPVNTATATTATAGAAEPASEPSTVATTIAPMLKRLLGGEPHVRFEFWDGTAIGPAGGPGVVRMKSPDALRRIVWSPDELGFGRAYVTGDIDLEGNVAQILRALQRSMPDDIKVGIAAAPITLAVARRLGALGAPLPAPPEEIRPKGVRHSIRRDKQTVSHHYDVGNDFYALVLGPSMTYSCARFTTPGSTLEQAQTAKHDLICRKLGLAEREGARMLDVGCGWGSMAIHAASAYGAHVVGVTISDEQAKEARRRVEQAGVSDRVEIRLQDYRLIADGPFDAISSVGMAEHVGHRNMDKYFTALHTVLQPGGRMLNHAISSVGGTRLGRRSFLGRYVFPDGELLDVGETVLSMERAGFEVRDVESLREHYAITLTHWVENLERNWDRAVELVGEGRARVWMLYMSGSINGFDDGGTSIHQVLGIVPEPGGGSHMAPTRAGWEQ